MRSKLPVVKPLPCNNRFKKVSSCRSLVPCVFTGIGGLAPQVGENEQNAGADRVLEETAYTVLESLRYTAETAI